MKNVEPIYTKQQILDMREQTFKFIAWLNAYLDECKKQDPKLPNWFEVSLEIDDEISFDCYGDDITIQWKEWDSCGGYDYLSRSFPLSDLWTKELD